jgi:predicted nucleotide-binding protein
MAMERLTRPRSEVELLLDDLIAQGHELVEEGKGVQESFGSFTSDTTKNLEALKEWVHRLERWHAFGRAALASAYDGDEAANEFLEAAEGFIFRRVNQSLTETIMHRIAATEGGTNTLVSLTERLRFAQEPSTTTIEAPAVEPSDVVPETIFIVHGHDEAAKHQVARFLERVKAPEVVILEEQPDRGRTIIEKFEQHSASAGYAVVLLTGDDEGRKLGTEELNPRARQNVILELGFFIAKLGRSRVAMLYQDGVERPSDIDGVLVSPLDDAGAWKQKLAREMRAAGVSVDADAVLRS